MFLFRYRELSLVILILLACRASSETRDDTARVHTGAKVFYPSIVLEGVGVAGYWVKVAATLNGLSGSADETIMLIPFGGLFVLAGAVDKGVSIAQSVRLHRMGETVWKNRLALQMGLYLLSMGAYGAAVGTGIGYALTYDGDPTALLIMLPIAAAAMTGSWLTDLFVFRKNASDLHRARASSYSVSVAPLLSVKGNNFGGGVLFSIRY